MADTNPPYDAQNPPPAPDMNEPFLAICPPAPSLTRTPRETLTDGVVTLRRWRASDEESMFRAIAASRKRLAEFMPWARGERYERSEAADFLARSGKRWDDGQGWDYVVTVNGQDSGSNKDKENGDGREDGEVAGSCSLRRRESHPGLDIGYWLADGFTGKGYVTRAAGMLVDEGFDMGAVSVLIAHEEGNEKSRAVPERLGFECAGVVEGEGGTRDVQWIKYPDARS